MLNTLRKGKIVLGGVCSLGIGFASLNLLPNTCFIDKLQEIVQMYSSGFPMPITENISKLFETVMNDMQINGENRERIQPFTVYGFDMFSAGSLHTKYGAIVGIPSNFYYLDMEDVETGKITVMNRQVDWLSTCAKDFKKSLVLSDEAQKFLIAREIVYVNSPALFLKSIYPLGTILFVYTLAHRFNVKLKLLQRPPMIRGILYILVSLFGFGLWTFLQDYTTVHFEMEADKIASALGEQYARGGLETYSKLIQRNICLRELMGPSGDRAYTATGNENYFVRQKHLPLSYRKAYMEELVNKSKSESCKTGEAINV